MVKTLLKTLEILEFISDSTNSPNVALIAANLKMNRVTVYRLVQTLVSKGYLRKNEDTHGYQIGLKFIPLAAKFLDNSRLRIESLPYLQELARKSGERVNLGVLFEGEVLYLAGIEKPSLPIVYTRFGKRALAHCCSLGKIILANLPEEEVDRILAQKPLLKVTEKTITDPDAFKRHLAETRVRGYAIDDQEHFPGGYCISALIRDSTGRGIGSISISSGDLEKIKGQLGNLLQTAEVISHKIGYTLR